MADGNFNRNILPQSNYRSGMRAGRSTERERAMKLFAELLEEERLAADSGQAEKLLNKFHAKLYAGQ